MMSLKRCGHGMHGMHGAPGNDCAEDACVVAAGKHVRGQYLLRLNQAAQDQC
jgi:hypothetical protein